MKSNYKQTCMLVTKVFRDALVGFMENGSVRMLGYKSFFSPIFTIDDIIPMCQNATCQNAIATMPVNQTSTKTKKQVIKQLISHSGFPTIS